MGLGEDGMFGVVRRKVDDEAEALAWTRVEKLGDDGASPTSPGRTRTRTETTHHT